MEHPHLPGFDPVVAKAFSSHRQGQHLPAVPLGALPVRDHLQAFQLDQGGLPQPRLREKFPARKELALGSRLPGLPP